MVMKLRVEVSEDLLQQLRQTKNVRLGKVSVEDVLDRYLHPEYLDIERLAQ